MGKGKKMGLLRSKDSRVGKLLKAYSLLLEFLQNLFFHIYLLPPFYQEEEERNILFTFHSIKSILIVSGLKGGSHG